MAENETVASATPTPAPAAPEVSAPVPGGDPSALAPTSQPTVMGSDVGQKATGALQAAQTNANNIKELTKPEPPAPPPTGHERLLAMISGLATGLGAAATSLKTGGREGGADEVTRIQGEEQQQKIQKQQAAQAQKNQQIQQQVTLFDTNHKLANSYLNLMSVGTALEKGDLEVKGLKQTQDIQGADYALAHGGMSPEEMQAALHSDAPASSQTGKSTFFSTSAQQTLAKAQAASLPDTDPFVQNLQQKLKDPTTKAGDLALATGQLANQLKMQSEGTDEKIKRESAEAAARPKDLNDATGRLAQATQAYKDTPTPATAKARDAADAALAQFQLVDRQKKQMEQDIQSGDPEVLGHALFAGTYAPSQLLSARSMSKPVYAKVIATADADAKAAGMPEIMGPNGVPTGSYFNAAKAEGDYEYSRNIQTQNTLKKIRTLNDPGGDLDILKEAVTDLPKLDEKTVNRIFNATSTEFGSTQATNYHMALYNVASLLANVQTGGIPTEGEIQTQLGLMKDSYSKGQLDGALQIARKDIAARGTAMVKGNTFLRAAYPELVSAGTAGGGAAAPVGSTGKAKGSDGNWYYHDAKGGLLGPASAGQ